MLFIVYTIYMSNIQSTLISNRSNWELSYQTIKLLEDGKLKFKDEILPFVGSIIAWPVLALFTSAFLPYHTYKYLKAVWYQNKMVKVLSNKDNLQEYLYNRLNQTTKILKNLNKDSTDEVEKLKYQRLTKEVTILQNDPDLNAISRIAELSFIKNSFNRQNAKECLVRSLLWIIPLGMYYDFNFRAPVNDQNTYAEKKEFLAPIPSLQKYDDLIDAHNQLIRENDFLFPFIEPKIVDNVVKDSQNAHKP